MKAFVNKIEKEELIDAPNMKEIEMFVREKIRRGVKREQNELDIWYTKGEFMKKFHQFEEKLVIISNLRGCYLSECINIILYKLEVFLLDEL